MDSVLLADLLDRGIKGVTLLSRPTAEGGGRYVADGHREPRRSSSPAGSSRPPGETMIIGFSDLHCNQATTELIKPAGRGRPTRR